MSILETIMFYAVSCSAVFMYGIGMERSFLDSGKDIAFFLRIPAMLVLSLGSFIVLWYPVSVFLVPFNLSYLVPVLKAIGYSFLDRGDANHHAFYCLRLHAIAEGFLTEPNHFQTWIIEPRGTGFPVNGDPDFRWGLRGQLMITKRG